MSFEYHEPTSVREAVELGARFGRQGRFLAGGTDLLVQMRRGQLAPREQTDAVASLRDQPAIAQRLEVHRLGGVQAPGIHRVVTHIVLEGD